MPSRSPIARLSNPILVKVFHSLDHEDHFSIAHSCRKFRSLVLPMLFSKLTLVIEQYTDEDDRRLLVEDKQLQVSGQNLARFYDELEHHRLDHLLRGVKTMHILDTYPYCTMPQEVDWMTNEVRFAALATKLARIMTNLEAVDLHRQPVSWDILSTHGVVDLELDRQSILNVYASKFDKKLRSVEFAGVSCWRPTNVDATLLQSLTKLTVLHQDSALLQQFLEHAAKELKNLTSLVIKRDHYNPQLALAGMSRINTENLTDLEIRVNSINYHHPAPWIPRTVKRLSLIEMGISRSGETKVLTHGGNDSQFPCINVEHLELGIVTSRCAYLVGGLNFPRLTNAVLRFHSHALLDNKSREYIESSLGASASLKSIEIVSATRGLSYIASIVPSKLPVKRLTLRGCDHRTEQFIPGAVTHFKHLTELVIACSYDLSATINMVLAGLRARPDIAIKLTDLHSEYVPSLWHCISSVIYEDGDHLVYTVNKSKFLNLYLD
ncbi:hypothetical protein TRVA0_045S01376 [Trichomonascus vanleenenianus]|uniref:uncharacterized protein n=1 Tax=Trichomonascus vanleenenianus TaxID=2268995 RepID=UPI003ECAE2AF